MKRYAGMMLLAAAALMWAQAALAEDTVESIEKAVVEQWDKLKSMSATLGLVADVKLNPEAEKAMHLVGGGSTAFMKKGDAPMYCLDVWAGLNEKAPMAKAKIVHDGVDTYLDTVLMGKNRSQKLDGGGVAPGGKALFDLLKEHATLSVLPSEKVDGKDVHVIEATPKEPSDDVPISKVRLYFAKDTGIPLKVEIVGKDATPMGEITMSDVKVNPELAAGLFVYTPPAPPAPPASPAAAPAAAGK